MSPTDEAGTDEGCHSSTRRARGRDACEVVRPTGPDAGTPVADSTGGAASGRSRTGGDQDDGYVVRPYEPGDRDGFLSLHETVFGGGDPEWFAWKYERNPYLPSVPMFVADLDGELVGARPFLGYPMRVGDNAYVGLQTGDTMVHPDHRRRGLFTRMTRQSLAHYADGKPAFTFNVPNAISRTGYLDLGFEEIAELATYHRVQRPAAFVGADGVAGRLAALSNPVTAGYLGVRDRTVDVPGEVTVARHGDVPAETLASLYRKRPPDAIHAHRTAAFFEYRFGNPEWEYTAYTARLGGTTVAGLVTGTRTDGGRTVATVADVVPLVGDAERDRGLRALLARVVADHRGADVIAHRGPAIPDRLLAAFGFLDDRSLPLSLGATPTVAIASPVPLDGDWRVSGRDLRDPSNWHPTFVEQNTR